MHSSQSRADQPGPENPIVYACHPSCMQSASLQVNRPPSLPHTLASRSSTYLRSMTCPQHTSFDPARTFSSHVASFPVPPRRPPPHKSNVCTKPQVQHRDLCTLAEGDVAKAETLRFVSNVRTQVCARWVRPRRNSECDCGGDLRRGRRIGIAYLSDESEPLFSVGMQHASYGVSTYLRWLHIGRSMKTSSQGVSIIDLGRLSPFGSTRLCITL